MFASEIHPVSTVIVNRIALDYYLRADVCKYRPRVGNIKILKNPKKIL